MSRPRTWLVVNARSGSNSAAARATLERSLRQRGMQPARIVEFPTDDLPSPAQLHSAGVERLIVFTGDGSVNALIAAVDGWTGEVLVLPGGTMNLLCARLHGQEASCEAILDCLERGAYRSVRPLLASCEAGRALAGVLLGPATAWAEVREAMREADIAAIAQETGEALADSSEGSRVRLVEPALGHADGYPLIELTPSHRGLQVDGYRPTNAVELVRQGWAMLRRRFREGPHERLGLHDRLVVENCAAEPIALLLDGEPASLRARAEFTVVECPVDLLATAHGF